MKNIFYLLFSIMFLTMTLFSLPLKATDPAVYSTLPNSGNAVSISAGQSILTTFTIGPTVPVFTLTSISAVLGPETLLGNWSLKLATGTVNTSLTPIDTINFTSTTSNVNLLNTFNSVDNPLIAPGNYAILISGSENAGQPSNLTWYQGSMGGGNTYFVDPTTQVATLISGFQAEAFSLNGVVNVMAVPEPSTYAILGGGLLIGSFAAFRSRKYRLA